MKRRGWLVRSLAVVQAVAAGFGLRAADARTTTAAPVELPPMMIEESTSSVPWLYVNAGGTEFLSRCSAATTRQLVQAWTANLDLVRAVVPDAFLVRMDVPTVFVFYAQDLDQKVSAEIQRELEAAGAAEPQKGGPPENGVRLATSMRLSDRDMHASIAYVNEAEFSSARVSVSSGHVRYLLASRVPALPAWAVDGVERLWRRIDVAQAPITFGPLVWIDHAQSDRLAGDELRPRAVLPASELFAPEPAVLRESRHVRRVEARAATQELFVRWALLSGAATRAAFWKLAEQATASAIDDAVFERTFGFDFAELRDRLSDYLPEAVEETKWLDPGRRGTSPRIEVDRATPNQIARIRGEWERLAIGYVQRRLPQAREPYIAQARRTLRRAYDAGDRDPRLLATLGLCEVEAGNDRAAREFLEAAIAGGVVRPRAHYELARLRFADLPGRGVPGKRYRFAKIAPVIEPLRQAAKQAPPLPEAFALLGEAWALSELPPNAADWEDLAQGARLFARRPFVAYPIALAMARHDRRQDALAILRGCADYPTEQDTRSAIARLLAELGAAPSARG